MIVTVTVNPALDVTLECTDPVAPGTVRPRRERRHAGGKGIDVARVVRNLGGESLAIGFLGGTTGEWLKGRLLQEGLDIDFVDIVQETRTNVIINAPDSCGPARTYRYNAPGPDVQPVEFVRLIQKIQTLGQHQDRFPRYAAVCGSLSGNMDATSYVAIIRFFKKLGCITVLDTSGNAMRESMRRFPKPDVIKPNIAEFNELIGDKLVPSTMRGSAQKETWLRDQCSKPCGNGDPSRMDDFWRTLLVQVDEFRNRYPQVCFTILSLGQAGILLVERDRLLHARLRHPLPPEKAQYPVGAGDAAFGAVLYALDSGRDWGYAVRLGVAAGGAAVCKPGTEAPYQDEVLELLQDVESHEHTVPAQLSTAATAP